MAERVRKATRLNLYRDRAVRYIPALKRNVSVGEVNQEEHYIPQLSKNAEMNKLRNYKFTTLFFSWLSIAISSLAIIQLGLYFITGDRLIALAKWDNALLRFMFAAAICFIMMNDERNVIIAQSLRSTGAVMDVKDSRWMVTETLIRSWVNLCVLFVIMCTIFTTPKEGEESVLDQTMNFTALLILIDLDTIFAQLISV